jgi:hypothetical protein
MPDFNDAPKQRGFDLIPAGTILTVQAMIKLAGTVPKACASARTPGR